MRRDYVILSTICAIIFFINLYLSNWSGAIGWITAAGLSFKLSQ